MFIASRLHFTPPLLIVHATYCVQNCAWCEIDWGEGITTTTFRFTCLPVMYHGLHFSLYPLPHSRCGVLPSTTALQTVQMVIMWTVDGVTY